MKFVSEKVKLSDLKAGELFHSVDEEYLNDNTQGGHGIKVFVRSNVPMTPKDRDENLYRIKIK